MDMRDKRFDLAVRGDESREDEDDREEEERR